MSDGTESDSPDVTPLSLSKETIILEVARASYAVGIGTVVTTILVLGVYMFGIELPEIVLFTGFSIGFGLIPAGLYVYDRYHKHDLVIADLGHTMARPAAFLYRILRAP